MKHNIQKITLAALTLSTAFAGVASAQDAPRLLLNGQPFRTQVQPVTQNGRVLVPLRDIFEGLGARVNYNDLDRSITARRQGTVVRMELGSRRAEINGQRVRLDVPASTIYGSTMVPLRFVSEALGASVNYNANRGVIRINDSTDGGPRNDGPRNGGRMNGDRMNGDRMNGGRRDGGRMDDNRWNDDRRLNDRRNGDGFDGR
jgi:hypothetical protein